MKDFDVPPTNTKKSKGSDGKLLSMLMGPLLKMFLGGGGLGGLGGSSKSSDDEEPFGDLFGTMISMFLG